MNTTCSSIRNLVAVTIILLGASLAGAATYQWTGAVDSNWSTPGNWTNNAAPGTAGTDNVWLEPGSPNPPSNQDIAGLYINTLTFNTNTAGFTINGSDIKLKKIDVYDSATAYVTNTVNCGIIIAANNTWNWYASMNTKCWLLLNGQVGESGVSAYIPDLSYGYLMLAGSNTFAGGHKIGKGTVKIFADRNLGAIPANYVTNYFDQGSGYGYVRAGSTGGVNRFSVHGNRGWAGTQLAAEPNVTVTLNAPLFGTAGRTFGGTRMNVAGSGTIQLAGNATNFSGDVVVQSGVLSLMHSNALGSVGGKVSFLSGATIELNGYNLIHNPSLSSLGYAGYDSSGMFRNSNLTQPSTFSGTINAAASTTPFGGPGDIIVNGPITNASAIAKTGAGTLILKGANTNFAGAFTTYLGGLTLDYTADNTSKIATNATLSLQQTILRLIGNASAATMQACGTIKATGAECGANTLRLEAAAGQPLTLAAQGILTDNSSGSRHTLDIIAVNNGGGIATLTTTNADGMLSGGGATWNQSTWAKVVGGVVSGMADSEYSSTFGSTMTNVDMPAGTTTISVNTNCLTMRFKDPGSSTLNIALYKLLSMGPGGTTNAGILVTSNSGPVTLNGPGQIYPYTNKGVPIHQYSTNPMTCNVVLFSGGGTSFLKCGPGELIVNSTNTAPMFLAGGTLTVSWMTNSSIASPLGSGSTFTFGNATFKYTGGTVAHNRPFAINGPATIDASGSGLLEFTTLTNVTTSVYAGNQVYLTLSGSGSGQMDGVLDLHLGGVIKAGSGTWTIGGTQYYTGDTIVSNGTLRLSNNCVLARSVRVVSGTLAGSARIGEDLVLNGTRRVEIRGDSDYDTLSVGLDTTLGGTLELVEMNGYKTPANLNMSIVTSGGTLSGSFEMVMGGSFQIKTSADGKQLLLSKRYPGFIFSVR